MRKFFIIASCIALAGFTSCSNDEEIAGPGNSSDNGVAPIALSMGKGGIQVSTRGTGAVGDVDNKWRGEKLNVYMLDKETFDFAVGYDGEPIFNNATITAPTIDDADNIYADYGVSKYYPMSGNFNFFMYRSDDAATGTPALDGDKYVLPITIDGSQDLMVSKAEMTEAQKSAFTNLVGEDNKDRYYSAFSARRKIGLDGKEDELGIQPHFTLSHLLSRLVFYVEPSDRKVSDMNADGTDDTKYYGVTIDAIEIQNVNTSAKFIVAWKGANPTSHLIEEGTPATVALKELVPGENNAHLLKEFTPVKPEWDDTNDVAVSKRVGESLMLFPAEEYELKIYMSQKPAADREVINYTHYQKLRVPTVNGKFEAGKQYNVKFVVYGAEKVEMSLDPTAWEEDGNIDASFDKRDEE